MLTFTVDVTAADETARTIEGLAVPFGEVAVLNGSRYSFEPGSLELARARTPLLLSHDQARPVGILSSSDDREDGYGVSFAVDRTPDGDAALAQAASGSRGGLSIGAEIDAFTEGDDGVRFVTAARILEVSLVSLPAFAGAGVELVAAELENDDDEGDQGDEPDSTTEDENMETVEAGSPVIITATAERPMLTAGEFALAMAGAQRGDSQALEVVRASLTESSVANLTGVLPPQYQTEVIGGKTAPRPLFSVFGGRPLPSSGLAIIKPVWGTHPAGGWLTGNVADTPSNAASITTQQADVMGWAWGIAIPYMIATRSDPDVLTAMYSEAVVDFHDDLEVAIAADCELATESTAATIGALIGAFYLQSGRNPEVVLVAPDVWGTLADAKSLDAPFGLAEGISAAGGLSASFAGLPVVSSGKLAAGNMVAATRRAIDARATDPVKLTVNALGALNVELGVVGEAIVDTDYPLELLRVADALPLARSAKK